MAKDKLPQKAPKNKGPQESISKRQSLNAGKERPVSQGLPGHEQDPKRRLGNFTGTGEHARQGGRQAGLIGQSRKKQHHD